MSHMAPASLTFISYSHDSDHHMDNCLALADRLRQGGVDCHIDQYEEAPSEGWDRWMVTQLQRATFVLVVCSETYARRFEGREEPGKGLGAIWEGAIITQSLYQDAAQNRKFIPVVFDRGGTVHIPQLLKRTTYYILEDDEGFEKLYRRLTGQHPTPRPELGSVQPLKPRPRRQAFLPGRGEEVQAVEVLQTIIREYTEHLLPGVVPRVSEKVIREQAILRGISGDNAVRAMHVLLNTSVLRFLGDKDELWVDLKRLHTRDGHGSAETDLSGDGQASNRVQKSVTPSNADREAQGDYMTPSTWNALLRRAISSRPSLADIANAPVASLEAINSLVPVMAKAFVTATSLEPNSTLFTMNCLHRLGLVVERAGPQKAYALSSSGLGVLDELVRLEPQVTLAEQMFDHPALQNVLRALVQRGHLNRDEVLRLPLITSTRALWQWLELLCQVTDLFDHQNDRIVVKHT